MVSSIVVRRRHFLPTYMKRGVIASLLLLSGFLQTSEAQRSDLLTIPSVSEPAAPPIPAELEFPLLQPPSTPPDGSVPRNEFDRAVTATEDSAPVVDGLHRSRLLRILRIKRKLERLKELAKAEKETPQPQPPEDPLKEEHPPTPQSEEPTPDVTLPSKPAADASATPDSQVIIPRQITSTVDRLALANNQFAQGKIDVAAAIYEKLKGVPQKPSDLVWIEYQLASCYRIQGKVKEATKLYRYVASSKDEYWASRAHWWLDYLTRSDAIFQRQEALASRFAALQSELDELRSPQE